MKKIISFVLAFTMLVGVLSGCGKGPGPFVGEWKFSKIDKMEIVPDADESLIEFLKEDYQAEDLEGVLANALERFIAEGIYEPGYLNFDGDRAYTYDPIMEREATWAVYRTGENEGFLSVYTELDVADGNPDPITNPVVVYDADHDVMLLTLKYAAFMVTIELAK